MLIVLDFGLDSTGHFVIDSRLDQPPCIDWPPHLFLKTSRNSLFPDQCVTIIQTVSDTFIRSCLVCREPALQSRMKVKTWDLSSFPRQHVPTRPFVGLVYGIHFECSVTAQTLPRAFINSLQTFPSQSVIFVSHSSNMSISSGGSGRWAVTAA